MDSRPTKKLKLDDNKETPLQGSKSNKKRKELTIDTQIDFSNVNLDDYKYIDLSKYKKYLFETEHYHDQQIKKIKQLIKETNIKIALKCEEENGKHDWITEREDCMYGERFTFCRNCKVDIYDRSYMHYY